MIWVFLVGLVITVAGIVAAWKYGTGAQEMKHRQVHVPPPPPDLPEDITDEKRGGGVKPATVLMWSAAAVTLLWFVPGPLLFVSALSSAVFVLPLRKHIRALWVRVRDEEPDACPMWCAHAFEDGLARLEDLLQEDS